LLHRPDTHRTNYLTPPQTTANVTVKTVSQLFIAGFDDGNEIFKLYNTLKFVVKTVLKGIEFEGVDRILLTQESVL
jgi:uncharacterized protein YvpB